jgi:hypothetical protein
MTNLLIIFYKLLFIAGPLIRPSFKPSYKAFRSITIGSETLFSFSIYSERTPGRLFSNFFHSFVEMDANLS